MATYDCDDFRVSFARDGAGSYSVTSRAPDGRRVQTAFTMPMTTSRLEEAVLQLGRARSREVAPGDAIAVKANAEELGGDLAMALFDNTLGPFFEDARHASAATGRGLRLTLSLAATPELLSVPWELLYRRPNFLASQRRTPVVRYLEVGDAPPPQIIEGTVRVLGVVASPTGLPALDVEDERRRVEQALAGMVQRGLVQLDWCDPATPRSLRERLRDGSYHILHYVGHSAFTDAGEGLLFLSNDDGSAAQITEAVLTNLLGDQTSLRLVVLNSCEGARTTLTDPFAGIATSIVQLGVPAVIAMQFTISDRAAITFADELFTSLIGRQYPVDAAVAEARKAVFTEVNEIEWATPVLFMRASNGQLFDFMAAPASIPLVVPPALLEADPDAPTPRPGRLRRKPDRVKVLSIGAVVVLVAIIAGMILLNRGGNGDADAVTIPPTVVSVVAVDPPPTCSGGGLPGRVVPPTGLTTAELDAFDAVQHWHDLIASVRPDTDSTSIWTAMSSVYPNQPIPKDRLTSGYANLEANNLIFAGSLDDVADGAGEIAVLSLIYDNPTPKTSCRTGFQCLHYRVLHGANDAVTITGRSYASPVAESRGAYYNSEKWFSATDANPVDRVAPVAEWMRSSCATATYTPQ